MTEATSPLRVAADIGDSTLAALVADITASAGGVISAVNPHLQVVDQARGTPAGGSFAVPTLLVGGDDNTDLWRLANHCDWVVGLPAGQALLRQILSTVADGQRRESIPGRVVAVTGVRGGCGATTVAVGLARALQATGAVALVDGDPNGAGLDLPLGTEGEEGSRWPEFVHLQGAVSGETLTRRLPRPMGLSLVSHRPGAELPGCAPEVITALRTCHDWVVVDIPRYGLGRLAGLAVHHHVLVVSQDLAAVTIATTMLKDRSVGPVASVALTAGVGPLSRASAAGSLQNLTIVDVPQGRALTGAADFGDLGDAVTKGRFGRACMRLADHLQSGRN